MTHVGRSTLPHASIHVSLHVPLHGVLHAVRRDSHTQTKVCMRPVHVPSTRRGCVPSARIREAIPGLPHGLEVARVRRVDLELPAKLHDVHVDGA